MVSGESALWLPYNVSRMWPEITLIGLSLSCSANPTSASLTRPIMAQAPAPWPADKDVPESEHPFHEEGTLFVGVGVSGAPMANVSAVFTSTQSQLLIGSSPHPVYDFFPRPAARNLKVKLDSPSRRPFLPRVRRSC